MEIARVEFVGRRRSLYVALPKEGVSLAEVEKFIVDDTAE